MTTTAEKIKVQRFTAYRREANKLTTHNENQKNDEGEPQFEGVIWSDGTVTLRWLTALRSHSVWESIGDMLGIHGHPEYGTEIEWHDGPAPIEWLQIVKEYEAKKMAELKPPDPEPLECWANQYKDGDIVAFTNIDTAMLVAQQNNAPRQAVLVREVTPQDEQDRKDAARYRWLIENGHTDARVLWTNIPEWGEVIDKAMEEE